MANHQRADVDWTDNGTPIARAFDDPYFSFHDGLAETRHVFLDGNDLPARLVDGFEVAELGFGTGLNAMALALATDKAVRFTSFEAFPLSPEDTATALQTFPEVATLVPALIDGLSKQRPFRLGTLMVEVIAGDARATLAQWQGKANAWFLDGFSPAKNPQLWEPELMVEVARHTAPKGTFATYTAAGHVRRALSDAGFTVTRRPGFGRKRHMSVGQL